MGWLRGLCGIAVLTGTMYGGYKWGRSEFERLPYEIQQQGGQYVVVDKKNSVTQPLDKNFQLGDIDYRVDGMFKEMKDNPSFVEQTMLKNFHKHYQPR